MLRYLIMLWFQTLRRQNTSCNTRQPGMSYLMQIMLMLCLLPSGVVTAGNFVADKFIQQMLQQRIEADKTGVGIVVGVVDASGPRFFSHGVANLVSKQPLTPSTVFEIGSISKTFTVLLLADMVVKGEVALSDPIARYLPKSVRVPSRHGRQITLLDLATHRAALPRNIDGYPKQGPVPSYAGLTVDALYRFLSGYQLPRDIGADAEYSNLGMGLLGHVLALRAGKPYETLIKERITGPLGMPDTSITLSPQQTARLAQGYDKTFSPAAPFEIPQLEGAGALRATPADLMIYLQANLGLRATPLAEALQLVHQSNAQSYGQKLAWGTWTGQGIEYTNHSGTTFAFKTYLLLDVKQQRGVLVMANSALTNVEQLAEQILQVSAD